MKKGVDKNAVRQRSSKFRTVWIDDAVKKRLPGARLGLIGYLLSTALRLYPSDLKANAGWPGKREKWGPKEKKKHPRNGLRGRRPERDTFRHHKVA